MEASLSESGWWPCLARAFWQLRTHPVWFLLFANLSLTVEVLKFGVRGCCGRGKDGGVEAAYSGDKAEQGEGKS